MQTVADVISRLPVLDYAQQPAPAYVHDTARRSRVLFGLEAFARHMTDEAWQQQRGLQLAGYSIYGVGYPSQNNTGDVGAVMAKERPGVAIMQDKREWDEANRACIEKGKAFYNIAPMKADDSAFRLTFHKDAHYDQPYHSAAHDEFGVHAWIVTYNPKTVLRLCPWMRPQHMIRAHHTVNPNHVPAFNVGPRANATVSGAMSHKVYPLRSKVREWCRRHQLPGVEVLRHPGYHARGAATPAYFRHLAKFKVSICCSSVWGHSFRKLIEGTVAGCRVITDLPVDDPMPEIDENFIRVPTGIDRDELAAVIEEAVAGYDVERQKALSQRAVLWYDYRRQGERLAQEIEDLRANYANTIAPVGAAAT